MAITKKQGREALARTIASWFPATTTSAGNAGGTTVVAARFVGEQKDSYRGYYLLLTSGTLTGSPAGTTPVFARCTAFDGTTGTFTVTPAFAGQVASSVTFELHAFSPELFTEAMNNAIAAYRRYVFNPLYDATITLTASTWEYTMPTGVTPDMVSRVMMEGTGDYDGIPDPRLLPRNIASYSQDGAKIWLNRGLGAKSVEVITGRSLYLVGKKYLTIFAKDTTYGQLVTDITAKAELTEDTQAWKLFMEFSAAELYMLLASGPMVQNRTEMIALSEKLESRALANAPTMRMREVDFDYVAAL